MRVPRNQLENVFTFLGLPMIFIHTPKCGGSYVNAAFGHRFKTCPTITWKEAKGHKTYLEYRDIFITRKKSLQDYVLFTVIRNPWDWHLSWFNYVSKDVGAIKSGMLLEHQQIKDMSFSQYLMWLGDSTLTKSKDDYTRRQVSDWIVDEHGTVMVQEILRQETLTDDLATMRDKYSLNISLPRFERINSSRQLADYRSFYDDKQAEMIARRHNRDIELFGYSFDPV